MQAEGAAYSGGIVGWFGGGNVADCQNNGLLSGAVYVGGVAGHIRSSNIGGELKNDEIFLEGCRNQGEITSAGVSAGIAAHVSNDGGKPIHIKNCENAEILEAYGTVGGIIGDGISAGVGVFIEGCTNIADLSAQKAGGIIGNLTGYTGTFSLRNCRNEGNVMATEKSAGGMIGEYYTYFDTAAEIKIENCMNIGKIEAAGDAGGIIGMLMGHASSFSENACINVTKCEKANTPIYWVLQN